jgi:hypothetical protein
MISCWLFGLHPCIPLFQEPIQAGLRIRVSVRRPGGFVQVARADKWFLFSKRAVAMTVILGYAFPTQAMEMQEAALLRSQSR